MNYFLKEYNDYYYEWQNDINYYFEMNKYQYGKNLHGFNDNNYRDLILYDKHKFRKKIPRISILFNDFDYISIYIQMGKIWI